MTTLKDRIHADMIASMKAGDAVKTMTLRTVLGVLDNAESAGKVRKALTDQEIQEVLRKESKKRRETAVEYREHNRAHVAEKEEVEADTIDTYLPSFYPEDVLRERIADILKDVTVTGPAVIGVVMKALKGDARVDMSLASKIARESL